MVGSLRRLCHEFRSLFSDERGSYLALTAFLLTGVMGFAGMGIDLSMWYQEKRTTQNIADAAAVAATHVSQRGGDLSAMAAAALAEAIRNGFEAGPNNQVIVAAPAGAAVGNMTPIVDVEVRRAVPLFVMAVFKDDQQVIAAQASGGVLEVGKFCVIGLDHTDASFEPVNNTTSRNVEFIGNTFSDIGCGVHSNSMSTDSLYIGGSATLIAEPAQAVGGIVVAGNGNANVQIPMWPGKPYVYDPLKYRTFPAAPVDCDVTGNLVVNSPTEIGPTEPGGSFKICGDLTVKPGNTLELASGVYYVEDGDILIQGTLRGIDDDSRVTIVLTGTSAANVGEIDIRAQAEVTLKAPSQGDYKSIAFMQDRIADTTGDNKFNGGASLIVSGYIYLKNQQLTYNGGSESNGCTFIVARSIKFSGNNTTYVRNTQDDCDDVGLGEEVLPSQTQVVLVQ